jgi:aryl-alcohol dehydrogenase-like predicted oxidoreductase
MLDASAAGDVTIGDRTIHRLGLGTMRLTGPGMFGPPADIAAANATLRTARELGINFIDTANAYGPIVAEVLVRQVLHPYQGMLVSTKGGMLRPGPERWVPDGRPVTLRAAVEVSRKTLGVDCLELWHLHRIDPAVPVAEQFGTIAELQRTGKIRHVGLSEVSIEQIETAGAYFKVACVQNGYHLIERKNEAVLRYCEKAEIPFIAYFPLATGALARADSILSGVSARLGITPAQAALAWLLRQSPFLVAIPGTCNPEHVRENVGAASVVLADEDAAEIERIGRKAALLRAPRP